MLDHMLTHLALRIIASVLAFLNVLFFLSATNDTEELPEEQKKTISLFRSLFLVMRAVEVAIIWIV